MGYVFFRSLWIIHGQSKACLFSWQAKHFIGTDWWFLFLQICFTFFIVFFLMVSMVFQGSITVFHGFFMVLVCFQISSKKYRLQTPVQNFNITATRPRWTPRQVVAMIQRAEQNRAAEKNREQSKEHLWEKRRAAPMRWWAAEAWVACAGEHPMERRGWARHLVATAQHHLVPAAGIQAGSRPKDGAGRHSVQVIPNLLSSPCPCPWSATLFLKYS